MVEWWWGVIGAAVPAAAVQQLWRLTRRKGDDGGGGIPKKGSNIVSHLQHQHDDLANNEAFVCERVCTSKRMLNKLGKDPNPSKTCATVCGPSQVDACSDACARSVCSSQHHVPNWNDICLRRCQNQCLAAFSGH